MIISYEESKRFVAPYIIEKAVNTLHGIVAGIQADGYIKNSEVEELLHWCSLNVNYKNRPPFNQLFPAIERALEDGILTDDEIEDLLWLCEGLAADTDKCRLITAKMQYLHGLVHGILADVQINDDEIRALEDWINDNLELKGVYPFDEIESFLLSILADGVITDEERKHLMAFLSQFIDAKTSLHLNSEEIKEMQKAYSVSGICSTCPEINVPGNLFCFTGESSRGPRTEVERVIIALGGQFANNVTNKTNYLIIGSKGNDCWAYSCFGRKVEKAVELRKKGIPLVIVNEIDFWDVLVV